MNISGKLLIAALSINSIAYTMQTELPIEQIAAKTIPEIKELVIDKNGMPDFVIGFKFYHGLNVQKNAPLAFRQFLKAAKVGNPSAMGMIKNMILKNEADLTEFTSDLSWLKRFSDEDDLLARSLVHVLLEHETVPPMVKNELNDYLKTKKPWTDLLDEKVAARDPYALYLRQEESSLISEQNEILLEKLKNNADQGDPEAAYNLAIIYSKEGPAKDQALAFKYAKSAADKEHLSALFAVAQMYRKGEGTTRDDQKFIEYMEKAAKLGDSRAQYEFAAILGNGLLGEGKFRESIEWTKKAASQGNGEALGSVNQI